MKVFVVTMRRWGDRERHSYVLGVYANKKTAEEQGTLEHMYRDSKYESDIREIELDKLHRKETPENIIQKNLPYPPGG